jgi:transposase-like protein
VPVTAVAEKHGLSRQTVHAWLSHYAAGGLEALADRSHRPRSCPHQIDPAVEVRLVSDMDDFPDCATLRPGSEWARGHCPD